MKKLALLVALAVGLCLFGIDEAQAVDFDSITVVVALETEISVEVTPEPWDIGTIALNYTESKTFAAQVGNVDTKLEIMGSDGDGGWVIGTPPDKDQFEVAVTDPAIKLTTSYQELAASVTKYTTHNFELTYTAPDEDSKGAGISQNFIITVKASAAP